MDTPRTPGRELSTGYCQTIQSDRGPVSPSGTWRSRSPSSAAITCEHLLGAAQRNAADEQHAAGCHPVVVLGRHRRTPLLAFPGHAGRRWHSLAGAGHVPSCVEDAPAVQARTFASGERRAARLGDEVEPSYWPGEPEGDVTRSRRARPSSSASCAPRWSTPERRRRPRPRRRRGRDRQVTADRASSSPTPAPPGPTCSPDPACRSPTPFRTRRSPRSSVTSPRATARPATSPRPPTRPIASGSSPGSPTNSSPRPPAQPLVVVVEDLHWADESTGDLLLFVGQRRALGTRRGRRVAAAVRRRPRRRPGGRPRRARPLRACRARRPRPARPRRRSAS